MDTKRLFWYDIKDVDDGMKYYFYRPARKMETKLPLVVWLHGSGETGLKKNDFLNRGLPGIIYNWTLRPFGAYVLCPQLQKADDEWASEDNKNKLMNIINNLVNKYNIDKRRIIIAGHSLGAMGAMYMVKNTENVFTKMVLLSGYDVGVNLEELNIPAFGVVGMAEFGEDQESVDFMTTKFVNQFGQANLCMVEASHTDVPKVAFNDDADLDGRSDLINWMFSRKG